MRGNRAKGWMPAFAGMTAGGLMRRRARKRRRLDPGLRRGDGQRQRQQQRLDASVRWHDGARVDASSHEEK
jgi:hypothetical protein